uniref:Uncharacterized protein LOC111102933 isoform X2 n=1 Tax=Crassostrea virginica TaxID=6565 RepID=A0A8B8AMD1_CRAVI|nr:uncharacterized protein LOC111102933 isoform X2 [Crassostrea virginica]
MMIYMFSIKWVLIIQISDVLAQECFPSIPTHTVVPSCPNTELELHIAHYRKQCYSLATIQNCTRPLDFRYHCVLNKLSTKAVELCAPRIVSQGFCIHFDEHTGILAENYNMDCTKFSHPCPKRFLSSDVMQYKECTSTIKVSSGLNFLGIKKRDVYHGESNHWIIILAIVACLGFTISIFMIFHKVFEKTAKMQMCSHRKEQREEMKMENEENVLYDVISAEAPNETSLMLENLNGKGKLLEFESFYALFTNALVTS